MNKDSVKVFLKLKPEFSKSPSVVQIIDQNLFSLNNKLYKFDFIAPEFTSNQEFFEMTMHPLLDDFLSGESILILTYGQSESGKTYTLFGGNKEKGIIEKTCERLVQALSAEEVSCRFLEIFQEAVFDLLAVTVKDEKSKGVDSMTEERVKTTNDIQKVLEKAKKRTGGGKGHTIFALEVKGKPQKMIFVDLAGADRPQSSFSDPEKAKESSLINKSLTALSNVLKSIASGNSFINYRDSKLTFLLKDCLSSSKLVLISTLIPSQKSFLDSISTLKFCQKLKKIRRIQPDLKELETNVFLERIIEEQSGLLKFYKEQEETFKELQITHSECEKKQRNLTEQIENLEAEIKMLRKEFFELEKIGNSDWILSSDSEDHESYRQISKEKSELEHSLAATNDKLSEKTKEVNDLADRISLLEKDREKQVEIISRSTLEIDELTLKCNKYQELCVMLGKLNSNLASEVKCSSDRSPELQDLSILSSTEASKFEIYRITEEKEPRSAGLAENCKTVEDLKNLKEKYFHETAMLKNTIAKLKKELEIAKTENIKENQYAMQVLEDLKAEKNKLLNIVQSASVHSENSKIIELKELNNMLVEKLKTRGQQISDLQRKFQEFLVEKECCEIIKKKFAEKKEEIRQLKSEFYRIRTHLGKFPQYRKKLDAVKLADFVIELFPVTNSRKNKTGFIGDLDRTDFTS